MRILIVDDEAAARERLKFMLEELDVEVVGEASNGLEAIQMSDERKPDLLLLDISMPEVDGFDVAQRLADPRPMIVFQTAFDEFALTAFDHEAVDYLVKPVTLDKLERAVDRPLRQLLQLGARDIGHRPSQGRTDDPTVDVVGVHADVESVRPTDQIPQGAQHGTLRDTFRERNAQ